MRVLLVLSLLLASSARADVIPPDYVPPPLPTCAPGARVATPLRGHGFFCAESAPCAEDAACGAGAHCEETALCVERPGSGDTLAYGACGDGDVCAVGTCARARRCVAPAPAPAALPPPPPAAPAASPAPASGGCRATPVGSPWPASLLLAAGLALRRARRRGAA